MRKFVAFTSRYLFLFIFVVIGFFSGVQTVRAQAGGPPADPVGVIPETPAVDEEPDVDYPEMTINLAGGGCEINLNESELLRVKGIVKVDIEEKPGKIVIAYDSAVTNKGLIKAAVGKKKGGCAADEDTGEVGGSGGADKGKK